MLTDDEKKMNRDYSESIANAAEQLLFSPEDLEKRNRMQRLARLEDHFGVGAGSSSRDGGRPGKQWLEYAAGRKALSPDKLARIGDRILYAALKAGMPLSHPKIKDGELVVSDDLFGLLMGSEILEQQAEQRQKERRERERRRSAARRAFIRGDKSGTVPTEN
jgi:hypothetical protein